LTAQTILVVDDEPGVLDQVARMLRRRGYTVVCHTSAQAALEWWREHSADACLVISDVVMPGMTGFDLVAEFRKERPDLPALLMSGYPDRVPRGVVGNLAPLLEKPFTMAQMLESVQGLLG
jgi:DNA-binding NtrC family response regulator